MTNRASTWLYAKPILTGVAILVAGLAPWTVLARMNLQHRPDLPWAALVSVFYLALLVAWLHGYGPPNRTALTRRWHLRIAPRDKDLDGGLPVSALLLIFVPLYAIWIVMSRMGGLPDLSEYPTTAYRWSMFLMGGITAGLVEEVAFRGYMMSGLERVNKDSALWITSAVFVASHITQGMGAVVALAPGLFIAAMLYGALARRMGSIVPGIIIHILGDLSRTYFGVLRGDATLLFVQ